METLLKALETGATVITVNSRLARLLRMQYATRMHDQQFQAWATPDVLSMKQWVARCWNSYLDHLPADLPEELMLPLDPVQESALWEEVVQSTTAGKSLLKISGAAEAACKAFALLREHGVTLAKLTNLCGPKSEPSYFLAWAEAFERHCKKMGRQSAADLPARIADLISTGSIDVGGEVWFAGFDRVTPVENHLREAMRKQGIIVGEWQPEPVENPNRSRISFPTEKEELAAAAAWAHSIARDRHDACIGIVVPELHKCAPRVRRAFLEEFHPEAVACGRVPRQTAFNISYGGPLNEEPVVRAALLLLKAASSPTIEVETASRLLMTPYLFGGGISDAQRGLADFLLRDRGGITTNFNSLAALLASSGSMKGAEKVQKLGEKPIPKSDELQKPGVWMERFLETLESGGWTIGSKLDSREQQAVDAWRGEIAKLEQLDDVVDRESMTDSLNRLRDFCAKRLFQPEGSSAQVQIMGLLEANNLIFTHLWVVGMHDNAWPPPASPTPFLPLRLQTRYHMGNSTPALAYAFAKKITERLMGSAPEIIASWPRRNEENDLRPSPFLAGLPEKSADELKIPQRTALETVLLQGAPPMEIFSDSVAPSLPKGMLVTGGTGLLKDQSACPFRAFAMHRLGTTDYPTPGLGLDSGERGSVVHDVLEKVWAELKDSENLKKKSDEELEKLVYSIASRVIAHHLEGRLDLAKKARTMETHRTTRLVMEWMAIERRREHPFRVEMVEDRAVGEGDGSTEDVDESSLKNAKIIVDLDSVKIHARRDRVDSIYSVDGLNGDPSGRLVIDYKTSIVGSISKAWDVEQPTEPQLLAYIAGTRESVDFIGLAQLRKGQCRLKGMGREELGLAKINNREKAAIQAVEDWPTQVASWTGTLKRLGSEFQTGQAEVNPRVAKACDFCCLPMFCRIYERENADVILGEAPEDEVSNGEENA